MHGKLSKVEVKKKIKSQKVVKRGPEIKIENKRVMIGPG